MPFNPNEFEDLLRLEMDRIRNRVVAENGEWTVKGFIDLYKRIYTITLDTKVLSKVLELLMFPVLEEFASKNNYEIHLALQQNHYPDLSFVSKATGKKYAVDIKSTYRAGKDRNGNERVSGMTLGTFMGYFRDRTSSSISRFPYGDYERHYVLGVIYSQVVGVDERKSFFVESLVANESEAKEFSLMQVAEAKAEATGDVVWTKTLSSLADIPSVAKDFDFFVQEKYRIAADRPGSGNTKNIGSTTFLDRMVNGKGDFANLGVAVFDDYWINYRTKEMARADSLPKSPYKNLLEYKAHIAKGQAILSIPEDEIVSEELIEEQNELPFE